MDTVKHLFFLLLFSVIALFFSQYFFVGFEWVLGVHDYFFTILGSVFSSGKVGCLLQAAFALFFLPTLLFLLCKIGCLAVKRKLGTSIFITSWFFWGMLVTLVIFRNG